jgi:hypothetical protein
MSTSTLQLLPPPKYAIPGFFSGILAISIKAQKPMYRVRRWKPHVKHNPKLRKQSTLEHAFSFDVFVAISCSILNQDGGAGIDFRLLQSAATLHDFGEGLCGRDIDYRKKSPEHDVQEYEAFCKSIDSLPKKVAKDLKRSFLLQFATSEEKIFSGFPDEARLIMKDLFHKRFREVVLFKGLEAFDYIFYGLESLKDHQCPKNLVWTLRDQVERLDSFVKLVPEFELVWTKEHSKWCKEFIEAHPHIPDSPF